MSKIIYERMPLKAWPVTVNGYLLWDERSGEAMMIDPGGQAELINDAIMRENLCLKYIVITHGHFDHIGAVKRLADDHYAKVCMDAGDRQLIYDSDKNAAAFAGAEKVEEFYVDIWLEDGQKLYLGDEAVTVLKTPGHTPGEISVYYPGHLFCGDTVLRGTTGRMDLYGADAAVGIKSIKNVIFPLPEDTVLHCGHNEESTVGYEKQFSSILRDIY